MSFNIEYSHHFKSQQKPYLRNILHLKMTSIN